MLDVTALVLEDHETLRRRFAALDDAHGTDALGVLWAELAQLLEVHAACEEEVFYPALLQARTEDGRDEAEDAIEDHNAIRDAVADAEGHALGSDTWWEAVGRARTENSKHIAEEEREALPDLRKHASDEMRADLAVAWTAWRHDHLPMTGVDVHDKDADTYIREHS